MSTPVTTSLNTRRRISQTDRVAIKKRGRVCAHDDCGTVLSIYNATKYCAAHTSESLARRRGSWQPQRVAVCGHCGDEFETRNAHRMYCSDRCRMAAFARRKRAAQREELRLIQLATARAESTTREPVPAAA